MQDSLKSVLFISCYNNKRQIVEPTRRMVIQSIKRKHGKDIEVKITQWEPEHGIIKFKYRKKYARQPKITITRGN
jgi:hypothetical protein